MKKAFLIFLLSSLVFAVIYFGFINKTAFRRLKTTGRWKYNYLEEFDSKANFPEDNDKETYTRRGTVYLVGDAKDNMQYSVIDKLDHARALLEKGWNRKNPLKRIVFLYTSARRSKADNERVNGVSGSAHIDGWAVDIDTSKYSIEQRDEILKVLYLAGFRRFGMMKNAIHVDADLSKSQNVVWDYDGGSYPMADYEIETIENLAA